MANRIIIPDNSGLLQKKTIINTNGLIETIHTQDIEGILENNKRLQNDPNFNNGMSKDKSFKHVGEVPLIVWKQWWQEECKKQGKTIPLYGKEMHDIVTRKLNDPDNRLFRTGLGQIGRK